MGFKEKMMDNMMCKMSAEEKKDMMDNMMENFFATMTKEEKQEMMSNMMPKMMEQMMGGENSMMSMMGSMMTNKEDKNENGSFNPMDMCKNMMSSMNKNSEIATFATPEVRQLFEEWVQEVDAEILNYVNEINSTDPEQIASHLKISKESVIYFLSRLAQKGKLSIKIENIKASIPIIAEEH